MSTPKNTPTPWHVGMKPGPMIYGPYGEQIADMREPMVLDEENRANIALIVRAVNAHEALVSALTETLRALRAHIASDAARTGIVAEYFCPCTKNEVARAEAALRAARGES